MLSTYCHIKIKDELMDLHSILLGLFLVTVIYGVVKGYGEDREIIVFRNYDDLGLTFLIPASFFLIQYIFASLGGNTAIATIIASGVSLWLLAKLIKNTYEDNGQDMKKFLLALITKLPLGIIWVFNLVQTINPSGKGHQRARNRGRALVILAFLTPIIGLLVVDKSGSFFNPKQWIRGRRVGAGVRNHL